MSSYAPKAVAAYYAAEQAHDDNLLDGDAYIAALHALDDWQPSSASDFVHKFIALHHDGGSTNYDRLQKLIEQARNVVSVTTDTTAWTHAAKAEQDARESAERFYAENVRPVNEAHEAGSGTVADVTAQEDAYGHFTSAHYDAMRALMEAPAPAWPAVVRKLRIGVDDWYFDGSSLSLEALQIIRADVERLADLTTDPAQWDAAMQGHEQASEAFAAHEAIAPGSDELDALCNAVTDAEDTLFETDAPHMEAVLWKLNLLEQESSTSSITPDQIRRVSADIRRLIGEA